MKTKAIPPIHVPIQRPDGSMEWVWYMFLQWVSDNAGKIDLSDYFTKEETEALLDDKVDKTTDANKIYGTDEDGEQTTYDVGGLSVAIDDLTITQNDDDELQAIAVIDQNTGIAKTWTGTMAEYEAIVTKDPETEYIIIDDIGGSATEIGEITEALNNKVDKGHQVIEYQAPTAGNNYTWYRKYADGWVEQGGKVQLNGGISSTNKRINFSIAMANTDYYRNVAQDANTGNVVVQEGWQTTTGMTVGTVNSYATTGWTIWEVKGRAA